jgi:hypothetical protein
MSYLSKEGQMAVKIDLPKEILAALIDQGISLRTRQMKQSTNSVIREALEQEAIALARAKQSIEKMA